MKKASVAIGVVEFSTIAGGIASMDSVFKNNDVSLLRADMICPGGYLLLFAGGYASVFSAVYLLRSTAISKLTGSVVIGNLSPGILERIPSDKKAEALGVIETGDTVSAVYAADEAVKTANVWIENLWLANGIGGKGVVLIAGGIAEVNVAVQKAKLLSRNRGSLIDSAVVTNPHSITCEKMFNSSIRRKENV